MNYKISSALILTIVTVFISSCKNEKKEEYSSKIKTSISDNEYLIDGRLKNVSDSTWVFVNYDNKKIDSTQVFNEQFKLRGSVEEPSLFFIEVGKSNKEYFFLWAENQIIEVEGEKGNLKNAKIHGGNAQKESEILNKRTDSLYNILDEIEIKYRNNQEASQQTLDSIRELSKKVLDRSIEIEKQFIKDFPNSYVSGHLLNIYNTTFERKEVYRLYARLRDRIKTSKNGLAIKEFLIPPETPKIGDKYINFELPDTNGNLVKLSDIKGKYILVEFWASWCGPCRKSNPKLIENYSKYKEKGLEIVGVSLDNSKSNWIKAIDKDGLPWKNLINLKEEKINVALIYGVIGIPDNFMIDKDGVIIAKTLRGDALENKLKELF